MPKTEAELVKSFQEAVYSLGLNWNVLFLVTSTTFEPNHLVAQFEIFDYDTDVQRCLEVEFRENSIEFEY